MHARLIALPQLIILVVLMSLTGCAAQSQQSGTSLPSAPLDSFSRPDGAIVLFDGHGFSHWIGADGGPVRWTIVGDAMQVEPGAGSIVTQDSYRDFRLHLEFNVPGPPPQARGQARGNSGVYIQRRYEVQILDSFGIEAGSRDCGALYRFKAPDHTVCRAPGQWQSYDITFRSPRWAGEGSTVRKIEDARISVTHNGVLVHDDVALPDKTGAGRAEGPEPGPLLLQDHGHPVRFRNIWIIPLD